ncbi:Shewanella-like protein phosphatase 1 [Linum grandiflorum]
MAIPLFRIAIPHQSNLSNACTRKDKLRTPCAPPQLNAVSCAEGLRTCDAGELEPIVVTGDPPTFVSAPGRRIVAVGDLHGDLDQTRCALRIAGVLSTSDGGWDRWTGGHTVLFQVLVQLGDVLDRGGDEIAILSLLRSLDVQARLQGGAVFQINGNHETMNVEGDFRYVDSGGFDECLDFLAYLEDGFEDDWESRFVGWVSASDKRRKEQNTSKQRQKGIVARSTLLKPGGPLACELAKHGVLLKINDWVFCHGGILPHHVAHGVERMNKEVSQWMRGLSSSDDQSSNTHFFATRGYDSVVWNRLYSQDLSALGDHQIDQVLEINESKTRVLRLGSDTIGETEAVRYL